MRHQKRNLFGTLDSTTVIPSPRCPTSKRSDGSTVGYVLRRRRHIYWGQWLDWKPLAFGNEARHNSIFRFFSQKSFNMRVKTEHKCQSSFWNTPFDRGIHLLSRYEAYLAHERLLPNEQQQMFWGLLPLSKVPKRENFISRRIGCRQALLIHGACGGSVRISKRIR